MKKTIILVTLVLLSSCSLFRPAIPSKWTGKEAYTKHGIFFEKNRHITTNYIRGTYLEPATKVLVTKVTNTSAELVAGGAIITIANIQKHTQLTMEAFLDRFLSSEPFVPHISKEFATNLKTGQPSIGMSKEEILLIMGYPPTHATYSLDSVEWKYWFSRYDTKALIFENNKLKTIRN